jgi:hypothetical protein
MTEENYKIYTIPNLPSLIESYKIDRKTFRVSYNDLPAAAKQMITLIKEFTNFLREEFINKSSVISNEEQKNHLNYLISSLEKCYKNFLSALKHTLERDIENALGDMRVCIEESIKFYLYMKQDISLDELLSHDQNHTITYGLVTIVIVI